MVKKFFSPELAQAAGLAMDRFPATQEEVAKAEQVLEDELQKLTLQEHEQILFSVHGLPRWTLEDDSVAMEARLNDLEKELDNITAKEREVYDEVRARNPTYVESTGFRRLFLRSESYDAKATADKIVGHFKLKKELFGEGEILCRQVCQSDLNPIDMELLEMGFMQVLSSRDVAGRAVMALSPEFMNHGTKPETLMLSLTRASWYFTMAMMQDEETQRNGAVSLMYNFCGDVPGGDFLLDAPIHQLHRVLPIRIEATHFCSSDPIQRAHVTGVQLFIDPSARFRLRAHHGTLQEINFALQTYGIPTQNSPMKDDGSWSNEWHKEWLMAQRVREEKLVKAATSPALPADGIENVSPEPKDDNKIGNDEIILVPRRFDVLFGKGRRERDHTGNLRAAHLCDMYMSQYESAHKFVKTEVAEKIVQIIHQSGGRFLKADNDGVGWTEVDDEAARDKIAHFFRFKRSRIKAMVTPPPSLEESSASDSSSNPLGPDKKRETFSSLTGNPPPVVGDDTTDPSNQTTISAQVNRAQQGMVTATCTTTTLDLSTIKPVPV